MSPLENALLILGGPFVAFGVPAGIALWSWRKEVRSDVHTSATVGQMAVRRAEIEARAPRRQGATR